MDQFRLRVSVGFGIMAALAVFGTTASPALAQVPFETTIQKPQPSRAKVSPKRAVPDTIEIDDPEAMPDGPPPGEREEGDDLEGQGEQQSTAPQTLTERSMQPTAGDDLRRPLSRIPVDGPIEDGTPTTPEVVDGLSDLNRDVRHPRDRDAFEQPPAGYDALAFQIEQIDPLNDRRTDRLFRFEPYDPRGIRIGSFVLYPETELGILTNNNLYRSSTPRSDWSWDARGTARLVSDWRAHALELRATGRTSYYDRYSTEDDRNVAIEARGRLDVTRRTNLEGALSHTIDKDVRALIDAPTNAARRGDITTDRAAMAVNQQFGRVTVQLRGAYSDVNFADVQAVNGSLISNAARNYTQSDAVARTSYALNRHAAVFAEMAYRERDYNLAASDGFLRSSNSDRYRMGLTLSPLGAFWRGEISVGYGTQTPKVAGLPTMEGFLIDANLAWKMTPITSFLLTLRSDFYDTTAAGSPGTLSREAGLEVRHAFRKHLIGTVGAKYAISPYTGLTLEDKLFTGEAGLDYYLNANASIYGRYQHLEFRSTDATRDYNADVVRIGLRLRQ